MYLFKNVYLISDMYHRIFERSEYRDDTKIILQANNFMSCLMLMHKTRAGLYLQLHPLPLRFFSINFFNRDLFYLSLAIFIQSKEKKSFHVTS